LLYNEIKCTYKEELVFKYISECFPKLKSIALIKKTEAKSSYFLGKNGVKNVIFTDELDCLEQLLSRHKGGKIACIDYNIIIEEYPPLLQRVLHFIEDEYLTIFSVTDISTYIGVTECTITREFKKNCICSPKRLVLYFKVMHSVELLKNSDLRVKEIANLSGFSNERRYTECFERVLFKSPSEFRNQITNNVKGEVLNQKNVINIK
jgi:AraC-like DNA-binding protein